MKTGKGFLVGYLVVVIGVIVWQLASLYIRVHSVETSAVQPQIAGAHTTPSLQAIPPLPDYPVLTKTAPAFAARHYVLYDVDSNEFLIQKDADTPVPLASTSKIMTTLITIEQGDLDAVTTVNAKAAAIIGSTAGLRTNERLTVRSLLYCALLQSGNDAAFSLANYMGSSAIGDDTHTDFDTAVSHFVAIMNQKSHDLGLTTFSFDDPSGLSEKNVGSAHDMALLAKDALQNSTFKAFVSTPEKTVTSVDGTLTHELKNSNRLVGEWQYQGAIGVKTGFTPEAGHNLVAAATRSGHTLIAVVFNTYSSTVTASAEVARDLLDFGWQSIEWR